MGEDGLSARPATLFVEAKGGGDFIEFALAFGFHEKSQQDGGSPKLINGGEVVRVVPGGLCADDAGDGEGFGFVVLQADQSPEALDFSGCGFAGFFGVFEGCPTGRFHGHLDGLEPLDAIEPLRLGAFFDRAVGFVADAEGDLDVFLTSGNESPGSAVAELEVARLVVPVPDEVDAVGGALPVEGLDSLPFQSVHKDLDLGNFGRGRAGREVMGEVFFREGEGLEGLALIPAADGDKGLGAALGAIDDVAKNGDGGLGFVKVIEGEAARVGAESDSPAPSVQVVAVLIEKKVALGALAGDKVRTTVLIGEEEATVDESFGLGLGPVEVEEGSGGKGAGAAGGDGANPEGV